MSEHYVAYGLNLRSAFRLLALTPREGDEVLPRLELALADDAELARTWSGSEEGPVWRGRLGDGSELTIDRGKRGDILFSNDDRGRYLFDGTRGSLLCAAREAGLSWQRTLLTKVLPSICVMLGYEALHACAVDSPWGAVAIAAPSSMGKTTLALELIGRGWPLMTDDVLALSATPDGVLAYPGTPHMNVATASHREAALAQIATTLGVLAGELWVAAHQTASDARPVRAVCLLERGSGLPLEAQPLPASPLPLSPYILGLPDETWREGARFELYSDLMSSASLIRLTCGVDDPPVELADALVDTLKHTANSSLSAGCAS